MSQAGEVFNSESQNVMSRLGAGISASQRYKEGVFDIDAREKAAITAESENRAAEGEGGVGGGSGGAIAIGAIRSVVNKRIGDAVKKKLRGKFQDLLDRRKTAQNGADDNGTMNETKTTPETSEGGTQTDPTMNKTNFPDTELGEQGTKTDEAEIDPDEPLPADDGSTQPTPFDDAEAEQQRGFEPDAGTDDPVPELDIGNTDDPIQDYGDVYGDPTDLDNIQSIQDIQKIDAAKSAGTSTDPATSADNVDTSDITPAPEPIPDAALPEPAIPAEAPVSSLTGDGLPPTDPDFVFNGGPFSKFEVDGTEPPVSSLTDPVPDLPDPTAAAAAADAEPAAAAAADPAAIVASQSQGGGINVLSKLLSKQGLGDDAITNLLGGLSKGEDVSDLLGAGADLLTGADAAGSSLLATAGSFALDALGPVGAIGGLVAGIWSAVSSDDALDTARTNAADYQKDVTYLSSTPQLSTGSIAMPTMDTTSFRTGGLTNF